MTDDIDVFVQRLQEAMLEEAKENYGEVFFKRWQHPLYMGAMADADVSAQLTGQCGDTISIYLKFENGFVKNASFETDGCAPSIVCGSYAAELSIDKSPEELLDISVETITTQLGGLPEEVQHCAFLAAATIHGAVDKYMIRQIEEKRGLS